MSQRSIMIVDDSPLNIDILFDALKNDYDVITAKDGESALASVHDNSPDLILLDVEMPRIDGYEVCRILKDSKETSHIPIMFITSNSGIDQEIKGLKLGAVDFITKPFNVEIVKIRVRNQLELKTYRDQLEYLVKERTHELELTQDTVIQCMIKVGEFRNMEIGEHILNVQNFVRIFSAELSKTDKYKNILNAKYIRLLVKCVPLHDLGKVVIPDSILLKPGRLTPEEFQEMKKHTTAGKEILQDAESKLGENSFLKLAMEMAEAHHERWDGEGYPNGLKGKNIPLPGRIMAIADVYDALTSRRVYKPPFTHEEAVEIITQGRGTQFDPDLVDTFLKIKNEFRLLHEQLKMQSEFKYGQH